MSLTTQALRIALATVAFCAAGSTADAKPRRVVVLDIDGPRALADTGRSAILSALGEQYDVVASKRWVEAKAAAGRKTHGPQAWSKASRQVGVDAVIEGYINDEGRAKVLTVIVTDASNGTTLDQLTIRLGGKGFTDDAQKKLRDGLEERFEWIEPITGSSFNTGLEEVRPIKDKRKIGAKRPADDTTSDAAPELEDESESRDDQPRRKRRSRRDEAAFDDRDDRRDDRRDRDDRDRDDRDRDRDRDDRDDRDDRSDRRADRDEVTEKRIATIETKESKRDQETNMLKRVFVPEIDEISIVTERPAKHVPRPTSRFRIAGGVGMGSRSFIPNAADGGEPQAFPSVTNTSFGLDATFYPFPRQKVDGIASGVGFSVAIQKSLTGTVQTDARDADGNDILVEFPVNQYAFAGGVHYRTALGDSFALDGELAYGQSHYNLVDAGDFEVPDVGYSFLSAGGALDLKITQRSTIGFNAKYLWVLGAGNLNDTGDNVGYGPGSSWGMQLGGNVVVPLPSNLFVRADLSYQRVKTTFDGLGSTLVEEESVLDAVDSYVAGSVKLGIDF